MFFLTAQQSLAASRATVTIYLHRSLGAERRVRHAALRSYAMIPDAPTGTWHHWAIYDIPATQSGLPQDAGRRSGRGVYRQAVNDFQQVGYGGPCPPRGHGPHHYEFRLLALSINHLPQDPSCSDVARQAREHLLAETVLTAVYQR